MAKQCDECESDYFASSSAMSCAGLGWTSPSVVLTESVLESPTE